MTSARKGGYGVLILIVLLGILGWNSLPPSERGSADEQLRERILNAYLIRVKIAEDPFMESSKGLMDSYAAREDLPPAAAELLALIYHLEGDKEQVDKVLGKLQALPGHDSRTLRYAVNRGDELPDAWEETLPKDWAGARIRAAVYDRQGDTQKASAARVEMLDHMGGARFAYNIQVPREILALIGLGLLISMFLSDRQWRKLGKDDFFRLKPLHFSSDMVFGFCMWFFGGLLVLTAALSLLEARMPQWQIQSASVVIYAVWGALVLRYKTFADNPGQIGETLELNNFQMRPFNLFQIFGGFTMVVACQYYGELITSLIGWPLDRLDMESIYTALLANPMAAFFYGAAACIIAPFFEEVFFRGLILRILLHNYKPMAALWMSSALFAVVHPFALWPIILFKGFALGVIYYRTANLLIVVWTHAVWNMAIILVSLAGVSG